MNYSGEAAEQVVRMTLEGTEVAAKITGAGAKEVAKLLYAVLRDQTKTKGKTRLANMLRTGKELKVFAVKDEDLAKFCTQAKQYGVLYCVLKDRDAKDGITDVMVRAEDASKINRIFERFKLATVDMAAVKTEITKAKEKKNDIPEPERELDKPFLMPIEDIFSIEGRGTVVTGRVERGVIKVGDEVEIVGLKPTAKTAVTGVEMFRKLLDQGQAGDNIGCLLRGTKKEEVARGQVLAKPASITPHTEFKGQVYVLTKDEGGRHTAFMKGYRPQFYIRTTDVTGDIQLPEGVEMVMPGDNVELSVKLIAPVALEEKMRFAIREGGRTVGAGTVSKIIK